MQDRTRIVFILIYFLLYTSTMRKRYCIWMTALNLSNTEAMLSSDALILDIVKA